MHNNTVRDRINFACMQIFAPLGIRIALTDVTTWTNGDIIEATSNAGTYLRNFGDAVQSIVPTSYDTAMLITYVTYSHIL